MKEQAEKRRHRQSDQNVVACRLLRRPRRFGPHGEIQVYGPGSARPEAQRKLDVLAACAVQRAFRQGRLRRMGHAGGGSAAFQAATLAALKKSSASCCALM